MNSSLTIDGEEKKRAFKDKQIRRYAVYVFFDADGIVDDYNCVFS